MNINDGYLELKSVPAFPGWVQGLRLPCLEYHSLEIKIEIYALAMMKYGWKATVYSSSV